MANPHYEYLKKIVFRTWDVCQVVICKREPPEVVRNNKRLSHPSRRAPFVHETVNERRTERNKKH